MEDLNFPICILKMNLQCCEDLPSRVKKLLRKVKGVYAMTIDPDKGLILVSGTVQPQVLIKTLEKTGQTPKLHGYEQDPAKAKTQFRSLLKRYKVEEPPEEPPASEAATPPEETCPVGGQIFRGFGYPGPSTAMQMPHFGLPPRHGLPGFLIPGPRPLHQTWMDVGKVETKPRSTPAPYPFDFYETKGYPATDSNFRYFSDDHAQPCSIM